MRIAKGEVVVICGPSGSGKSTLIKCINGLEPFKMGTITVDGISVGDRATNLPKLRSRIGMVFQNFELFPHMTAGENIVLAQQKVLGRDRPAAEAKARELLERMGLAEQSAKYPAQLSGGQQQRVAIARALAMDPIAMLFDEPTSALDPEMITEVLDGQAGRGGHDHGGGHARDGLRAQGRPPHRLHGPGRHRRGRRQGGLLRHPPQRARAAVPLENPGALTGSSPSTRLLRGEGTRGGHLVSTTT
jgi:ABC-type ATPase involved in cell division